MTTSAHVFADGALATLVLAVGFVGLLGWSINEIQERLEKAERELETLRAELERLAERSQPTTKHEDSRQC